MVWLSLLALTLILFGSLWKLRIPTTSNVLVVLGSGGHTGEMLAILKRLSFGTRLVEFIYSEGDSLSIERARKNNFEQSNFYGLPRARKVGQSMITSIISSLKTLIAALVLLWRRKPEMILCNGPGTCVMVIVAAKLLFLRTKIVYVESLARVKTLSFSGKIIYQLKMADRFVVQWQELADRYPDSVYAGILV